MIWKEDERKIDHEKVLKRFNKTFILKKLSQIYNLIVEPRYFKGKLILISGTGRKTRRKINYELNIVSHVLYLFALPSFSPRIQKEEERR
jgi:hypothetical protein